jgi:nickel/cobalt transporter (NicO) family protein
VLPDHWVPLAVLGRTRRLSLGRVTRLSGAAGIAHVLVSIVLGVVVIAVGLQFRSTVEHAQGVIIGGILLATGLAFAVAELTGHGHTHDEHGHTHDGHTHVHHHHHEPRGRWSSLATVMVPFGAAASPDLTILPVFLAATSAGIGIAIGSLAVFAAVTIGTIVGLTVAAAASGYRLGGAWLDRWGNACTALTLLVIGGLVLTGVI